MDNEWHDGAKWYRKPNGYWVNNKYGYQHVYVWEQAHQATVDQDDVIHHINEDKEDNRIENLQLMTRKEHVRLHQNGNTNRLGMITSDETRIRQSIASRSAGLRSTNKSGYKGVSWDNGTQKWRVRIHTKGKLLHLGLFLTPEQAAHAYDTAARKYFGDDAFQNFPAKINTNTNPKTTGE